MKNRKVIANAKKNHNLFILDLVMPGQLMLIISKAMVIIKQNRLINPRS